MHILTSRQLFWACAGAALLMINGCGGGASPTQASAQTISFTAPGDQKLGQAAPALVATSSSGLAVSFVSYSTDVCTVSGNSVSLLSAGTCKLGAAQAGNVNFAAAEASQSFNVALGAQSISFVSPGNRAFTRQPITLLANASSGLLVTFASSTPSVCTVNGNALSLLALGTCNLNASQTGNASYAAAAAVSNSFVIAAAMAAQTISFNVPANPTLGAAPLPLVASASSGLVVSFVSTTTALCSVSGNTTTPLSPTTTTPLLTLLGAGNCMVVASQSGDLVFAGAAPVLINIVVLPTAQSITLAPPGPQRLGTAPAPLLASATSALPVVIASTTPSVCSATGNTLVLVSAGTCSLTANQPGNINFAAAAPVSQSFSVVAALAPQSINFSAPANATLGTPPAALVASASSGLTVSLVSTTPTVCTVNGNSLGLVAVGPCSITASQLGNATYEAAASVTRVVTVLPAVAVPPAPSAQTITFNTPGPQRLGTTPATLVATSSSGLVVSFVSTTTAVCTVNGSAGNTLSLLAAGTCSITASQAGNAVFAAAAPVVGSFAVVAVAPPLAQVITFAPLGAQQLGTTPPALVATSSSGLLVSFASLTTSVCIPSGNTLNLLATGTCSISASQAGNSIYAAAAGVTQSFTVVPAAPAPIELLANGGFEVAPGPGQIAFGWRGVSSVPATLATDARTGTKSLAMAVPDPGFGGSGLVQNNVDDGGLAPVLGLYVGKTTTLTFWAKGNASITGNVNFSLRYLTSTGVILNPVINTSFGSLINASTWTKITLNGPAIPALTSAIFVEMTLAVGPTGVTVNPDGSVTNYGQAKVLIDDMSVTVPP
jgi:ribosomal protein S11